ncbi:MAG TPA: SurA N-terminal domain-containing protein [Rhizomicrobium sp.]|nr:SurA N-terminal domain-containing protein [Rhizomicrobium sp.]
MSRLSRSWPAQLLMGALALSFIIWGIADVFTGQTSSTAVATVGPAEISAQDFTRDYRNVLRNQSQQSGVQITAEMAQRMGIGPSLLQQMISRAALDNKTAELKLTTPDAQLSQDVRAMPSFRGASGNFDHTQFLQIIAQAGYNERDFLELIRSDETRDQLTNAMGAGFRLPDGYAQAIFLYATEQRAADYVVVSPDSLGPVAPPADSILADFVKAHPERFSTPEYRELEYAAITPQDVVSQVNVTDQMIADEYKSHLTDYMVPEKRDIQQIEFPSEADAKAAHDKIVSGAVTFEVLAAERKISPQDLSLGTLSKADLSDQQRADAAFALPLNQVSDPVKGAINGYVLLRVTKITPAVSHSLDEVKDQIRKQLALQLAGAKITDVVNAFEDARSGGADIATAAKKVGMHSGRIAAVDRNGLALDGQKVADLPPDPEFLSAAFSQEVGEDNDPFPAKSGASYAIKVVGVTPAKLKPLDQVRADALAAWTVEEKARQIAVKAQALAAQAQKDGNLGGIAKELKVAVQQSPELVRATNDTTFSSALIARLFNAPPGGVVAAPQDSSGNYVIAKVTGISHPRTTASAQIFAGGKEQLSQQAANDLILSLANAEIRRQGVTVNQQLLQQAIGGQ